MKEAFAMRVRPDGSHKGALLAGVLIIFVHPCFGQSGPFDPSKQQNLSVENADTLVRLTGRYQCDGCPSSSRFTFDVRDKAAAKSRTIALANQTAQIDQLHVFGSTKLIVVGRVLANTSIVTIIDLPKGTVSDLFYCFLPAISPDGHRIAFIKVYPAHFAPGVSAVYLLYDVRAAPEGNRKLGILLNNNIDVGQPIFPTGAENRPGDNLSVVAEHRHVMASDRFYWTKDSSSVMFVNRTAGKNSLVEVDVSRPEKPEARVVPLPTTEIINSQKCEEFRGRLEESFHTVGITPEVDRQRVTLRFQSLSPTCLERHTFTVSLPGRTASRPGVLEN